MKDPVLVGAIAVVSAMVLSAIKEIHPDIYYGSLITLVIFGVHRHLKSSGRS